MSYVICHDRPCKHGIHALQISDDNYDVVKVYHFLLRKRSDWPKDKINNYFALSVKRSWCSGSIIFMTLL